MQQEFWQQRWDADTIDFHEPKPNPLLVKHFGSLSLAPNSRVFLPLCGKTSAIGWLLDQGYRVVGAEFVIEAVDQLFDSLNITPHIDDLGGLLHYKSATLDIFAGDIFDLSVGLVGEIDAIFDRAALVALPAEIRPRYTAKLIELSDRAKQLMICFEYDQSEMPGPPFSISAEEVQRHYGTSYEIGLVDSQPVAGGLKGQAEANENAWKLIPIGISAKFGE